MKWFMTDPMMGFYINSDEYSAFRITENSWISCITMNYSRR